MNNNTQSQPIRPPDFIKIENYFYKKELFIKDHLLKKKVLPNSKRVTLLSCSNFDGIKIHRSIFWMNELTPTLNKIKSFVLLEQNWGSYGEDVISKIAINNSLKLANRIYDISQQIDVFPMRDGGVQFELRSYQNDAEIEISPSGRLSMILFDKELNSVVSDFHLYKLRQHLNCPSK